FCRVQLYVQGLSEGVAHDWPLGGALAAGIALRLGRAALEEQCQFAMVSMSPCHAPLPASAGHKRCGSISFQETISPGGNGARSFGGNSSGGSQCAARLPPVLLWSL